MSDTALDKMLDELYGRVGEKAPQPRLSATRKALELLGDPHRSYPIVHITGTNGKTSTSRMIESILRAHGLRTGLFTSPDLGYLGQRIVIDGEPIAEDALIAAWAEVTPFLGLADAELAKTGEPPLTFFEALTVLAYAVFADAPDRRRRHRGRHGRRVGLDERGRRPGRGLRPIDLDHTERLGRSVEEIARTKAGIIKPAARWSRRRSGRRRSRSSSAPRSCPRRTCRSRAATSACCPAPPPWAARSSMSEAGPAATTGCSSPSSARTRRRTPPSRSPPSRRSSAGASSR